MIGSGPKVNNKNQLSEEELVKIQPGIGLSEEELIKVNEEIEKELDAYLEKKSNEEEKTEKTSNLKFYGIIIVLFLFIIFYKLVPIFVQMYQDFK